MRINKASEAVLAKYAPQPKLHVESISKPHVINKKGTSLQDFYHEVYAKGNLYIEQIYNGKNAEEIESMMVQNRRLIETKRN